MDTSCVVSPLVSQVTPAKSVLLFPFQIGKEYEVAIKPGPSFKVCHFLVCDCAEQGPTTWDYNVH